LINANFELQKAPLNLLEEVFKCLLHTIVFHRALSPQIPSEDTIDDLNVTYALCDDEAIKKDIKTKVESYVDLVKKNNWNRAQMIVTFYEIQEKQTWLGTSKEKVCWEQWIISLEVFGINNNNSQASNPSQSPTTRNAQPRTGNDRMGGGGGDTEGGILNAQQKKELEYDLLQKMTFIGKTCCEPKTHLPRLRKDPNPFPFDITYQSTDTWGNLFWNILRTPTPLSS